MRVGGTHNGYPLAPLGRMNAGEETPLSELKMFVALEGVLFLRGKHGTDTNAHVC